MFFNKTITCLKKIVLAICWQSVSKQLEISTKEQRIIT
jgi:hypothetical protein